MRAARIWSHGHVAAPRGKVEVELQGVDHGPPSPRRPCAEVVVHVEQAHGVEHRLDERRGLDAHEARHHVGVPDVEQHPVGRAVEPLTRSRTDRGSWQTLERPG